MQIQEGLKAGDLEGIIEKRFSVDQYKSKMGEDRDVCVVTFVCNSQSGAKDLEQFAEKGYKKVLDADATPGTMEDGKYRVFIEFPRDEKLDLYIGEFLEDLKKLTNIDVFTFTYHKSTVPFEASRQNLADVLPRTPIAYSQKINALQLGETKNFFDKYNMMEFKLDNNIISVKKTGSQDTLKFELHAYGNTPAVLKEVRAFKIDTDSMSEVIHLTKFLVRTTLPKLTKTDSFFQRVDIPLW
jgi:hypothetical protein